MLSAFRSTSSPDPRDMVPQMSGSGGSVVRRSTASLGLQGKLILSFLVLLSIALGASCWLFADQSSQQLSGLMAQQARLVAYTLTLASEQPLAERNVPQLKQIGQDLLDTRNVLYVAFLDADKKPIELANRYADFGWEDVAPIGPADSKALHVVTPGTTKTFGDYVDVFTPVISRMPPAPRPTRNTAAARRTAATKATTPTTQTAATTAAIITVDGKTGHLAGYVVVGVSLDREQAQLRWVNWIVAGIGVTVVLLSLPLAYLIVYGIFKPIRHLVDATRKLAMGRLDIKVEVDRDDMIGELAESFRDMVDQLRRQREDLARTNSKLADANEQLGDANKQLADANRGLEEKVLQRTAQLEAANRRLSAEIAEKEDFLRAVSHDLNAPLRNISGMASMLLAKHRANFDEDVVHRLERIQKNVEVETDLIGELLELSRIKTRRQKMEPMDLENMVRELGGMFEEDLRSKQIQLVLDTPLPQLTAERARIRQVFQNLIDNAIKYMGSGPVREIHVGCDLQPDEAHFYVRDTGAGIEPEDVDKVFNVFRRGKSAVTAKIAGKGVGLSSVKSIIQTYSGTIWVESTVGQGSTFHFTINGQYVGAKDPSAFQPAGAEEASTESDEQGGTPEPSERRAA
jgi:signal transduction histidine kinase